MQFRTTTKCFQHGLVALKTHACMQVTAGDCELAITATQFSLVVELSANTREMGFELVENMLRSFLAGRVWQKLDIDSFTQQHSQFTVRFTPKHTAKLKNPGRREVQEIRIALDFAWFKHNGEFAALITLADLALTCVMRTFAHIAPAVFSPAQCLQLAETTDLLRPLKICFDFASHDHELENMVESAILCCEPRKRPPVRPNAGLPRYQRNSRNYYPEPSLTRPDSSSLSDRAELDDDDGPAEPQSLLSADPWLTNGDFFGSIEYAPRRFIVLTSDGDDEHEAVYFTS